MYKAGLKKLIAEIMQKSILSELNFITISVFTFKYSLQTVYKWFFYNWFSKALSMKSDDFSRFDKLFLVDNFFLRKRPETLSNKRFPVKNFDCFHFCKFISFSAMSPHFHKCQETSTQNDSELTGHQVNFL